MIEKTLYVAQTIGFTIMIVGGIVLALGLVAVITAVPFTMLYDRIPIVRWWQGRGALKRVDKSGKYAVGMWTKSGFVPLEKLLEAYEAQQENTND